MLEPGSSIIIHNHELWKQEANGQSATHLGFAALTIAHEKCKRSERMCIHTTWSVQATTARMMQLLSYEAIEFTFKPQTKAVDYTASPKNSTKFVILKNVGCCFPAFEQLPSTDCLNSCVW